MKVYCDMQIRTKRYYLVNLEQDTLITKMALSV